jgi:transcriptional regulator with XRE-family HTH domain
VTLKRFSRLAGAARADTARRDRIETYKRELLAELSLAELRLARQKTQRELADALQTTQSGVSRLEHQTDLYLSTLRKYVEALGGKLEVCGVFPDARIPITSFEALTEEASPDRVTADANVIESHNRR